MSDLIGGSGPSGTRGSNNGNGRATAPNPGGQPSSRVRTPRDIMKDREARQRARQERPTVPETEQVQRREDDELRRQVERRSAGFSAQPRDSGYKSAEASAGPFTPGQQAFTTPTIQQQQEPPSGAGHLPQVNRYAPPPNGRYERFENTPLAQPTTSQQPYTSSARPRTTQVPQDDSKLAPTSQPTAMTSATATSRAPQQQIQPQTTRPTIAGTGPTAVSQQAQPSSSNIAQPVIGAPAGGATGRNNRDSNVSSFPHAFERWETLSSRWEGLTSYWIRKLETNPQKADINQEMARQITDLAAAGANLFHAVVELQRLRASSERKFQRWFFETRAQQEEAQENEARLRQSLEQERARRIEAENARAAMPPPEQSRDFEQQSRSYEQQNRNYERLLGEYKRELQISKDEARRAWEDLGRQEAMERDRIAALRDGHPIEIGGVQVVPHAAPSRAGSMGQRPGTQGTTSTVQASSYQQTPRSAHEYSEEGYGVHGNSPTNTDPFSSGEREAVIRPPTGSNARNYPQQPQIPTRATSRPQESPVMQPTAPAVPSSQHTRTPSAPTNLPAGTSPSERFYTQQPQQQPYPQSTTPRQFLSGSETEEEPDYELDENGQVRIDASGNPIVARGPSHRSRRHTREESDDSSDLDRQQREQRRNPQAYSGSVPSGTAGYSSGGGYMTAQEAEVVAGSSAGRVPGEVYEGRYAGPAAPEVGEFDDEGEYAEYTDRHHHPTRLSDVPEEDERSRGSLRSAREIGGAGGASAGMF